MCLTHLSNARILFSRATGRNVRCAKEACSWCGGRQLTWFSNLPITACFADNHLCTTISSHSGHPTDSSSVCSNADQTRPGPCVTWPWSRCFVSASPPARHHIPRSWQDTCLPSPRILRSLSNKCHDAGLPDGALTLSAQSIFSPNDDSRKATHLPCGLILGGESRMALSNGGGVYVAATP